MLTSTMEVFLGKCITKNIERHRRQKRSARKKRITRYNKRNQNIKNYLELVFLVTLVRKCGGLLIPSILCITLKSNMLHFALKSHNWWQQF